MGSSVVLELAFDLDGRQTSAILREVDKVTPIPVAALPWEACRVCLRRRPPAGLAAANGRPAGEGMRHLFETTVAGSIGRTLADLMEQCASIPTILRDENTPQHICARCEQMLHTAVQFKQLCERSDNEFRTLRYNNEHNDDIKRETTEYLEAPVSVYGDVGSESKCGDSPMREADTRNNDSDNDDDEEELLVVRHHRKSLRKRRATSPAKAVAVEDVAAQDVAAKKPRSTRRPFKCKQCPSAFAKKYTLTVHERSHTGERPYACDICSKAFRTYCAISAHIVTHTGERNYACTKCPHRTSTRENLRIHERSHVDSKAYACAHCPARFKTNSNMHKHVRTVHLGVRAFACDQCTRTFSTNETLRKHSVRHSGIKPYACSACWRSYSWYTGLQKHVARHHFGVVVPAERSFRDGDGRWAPKEAIEGERLAEEEPLDEADEAEGLDEEDEAAEDP